MWKRLFSFVLMVGLIWLAAEVYSKGTSGAFGGAIAWIGSGDRPASSASTFDRIQGAASGARDRQLSRIEGQLGDEASVGLSRRESADAEE